MSDLIDLTSPDSKKVLAGPKLSSPLIPLPANHSANSPQLMPGLKTVLRRSIDDNPFDIELRKTNEFISKSEDPFEVVWQKVNNADGLESRSADFNKPTSSIHSDNDPRFKHKRHSDILKMNKTLDESLISGGVSSISKIIPNQSTMNANDALQFNSNENKMNKLLGHEELHMENKMSKSFDNLPFLSINPPSPDFNNLSILNQSVMNDSFSLCSPTGRPSFGTTFNLLTSGMMDSSNGKETNHHNTSILNQSAMNDSLSGTSGADTGLIKSIVARRIAMCIQKGITDAVTEFKIPDERHQRLRRSFSQGDQLSLKHFQQVHSQSNVGDRLQIPNDCSMPTLLYEDPFNKGFMTGSSGDKTAIDISNISSIKRINSAASSASSEATASINNLGFINDTTSSGRTISNGNRTISTYARHTSTSSLAEISDLVAKFDRLKAKSLRQSLNTKCSLIDLDKENSNEKDGIQQQNTTTDSVFFEYNSIKQSTSSDELVKSLNKCSLKTGYDSDTSGENSLPKRPPSAMGLLSNSGSLPSNHNSDVTDNLIELQTSDTNKNPNSPGEKVDTESPNVQTNNDEETKIDVVKEFDKELIEPENKLTAATLLMELEKLVNNEKNPKAVELLQNLERVLGVKCDNNVELLEMFIPSTESMNEVRTNPENDMLPLEKFRLPSEDTSKEDNTNIDSISNPKQLSCDNFGMNDNSNQINIEKTLNRNDKLSRVSSDCYMRSTDESSTTEQPECPINRPENPFSTQKLVVDIQIALQNLLTSNNSDPIAFLESLNKVLNPAANEFREKQNKSNQIAVTPVRSIPKSPLKRLETSNLSTKSSTMRRSAGSTSALKKSTGLQRHSSVSQIVRTSNDRNTKIKTRIDSPKKSISKRASSDQSSINDIKITKKLSLDPIKLKTSVPIVNKKKLRTNNDTTDKTIKKGPLKAFLPISNMQQRGILAKKVAPLIIPPYSPANFSYDNSSAHMSMTSTPNPDVEINLDSLKTSPKRKPVASSTPDVHSKISRVKFPKPSSPKHNMSWNISPVTPNESRISTPNKILFTGNNSMNRSQLMNKKPISPKSKSRSPSMRMEKVPEAQKKISLLPRDELLSQCEGKLRYGRHSEPVKNTIAMKKIASPLKESNTPGKKIKPLNLISKFQLRSATKPLEKENKWK